MNQAYRVSYMQLDCQTPVPRPLRGDGVQTQTDKSGRHVGIGDMTGIQKIPSFWLGKQEWVRRRQTVWSAGLAVGFEVDAWRWPLAETRERHCLLSESDAAPKTVSFFFRVRVTLGCTTREGPQRQKRAGRDVGACGVREPACVWELVGGPASVAHLADPAEETMAFPSQCSHRVSKVLVCVTRELALVCFSWPCLEQGTGLNQMGACQERGHSLCARL